MIDENKIEELKSGLASYVRIITQADRKAGSTMFKCPLCGSGSHGGRNSDGAFSIKKDGKTWHCFSCGKGGDIFALIKEHEGISDFRAQVERAAAVVGVDLQDTPPKSGASKSPEKKPEPKKANFKSYVEKCHAAAGKTDYFMSRGFDEDVVDRFLLGYDERKKAIVIPYDRSGSYYITRSIEDKRFRKPSSDTAGVEPIYNKAALQCKEPCFVCESAIDAISIKEAGLSSCNAIALGGTGYSKLIDAVKEKQPACVLILSLDNDAPGQEAQSRLAEELRQLDIPFMEAVYSYDAYPEDMQKDANDLFRGNKALLTTDIVDNVDLIGRTARADREEQLDRIRSHAAVNMVDNLVDEHKHIFYVPTGFKDLDEELDGGLYPGLYILGAISSLGKTTMLLQIADQIAAAGYDVAYFTLEMSGTELVSKSISRHTYLLCDGHIHEAKTARGIVTASRYVNYSQKEKDLIQAAMNEYKSYADHLYMYVGMGDLGVKDIKETIEEHIRIRERKPVIFVDYLQILAPYDMRASDKQNTDKAVLELKRLSRDLDTPVVAISSFNRDNYSTEVNMAAFKESGAIEYGSDVLLAIQPQGMKPGYNESDKKENVKLVKACKLSTDRKVEVVILKNRNGRTGGKIGFVYHALFNCFEDEGELPDEDNPFIG